MSRIDIDGTFNVRDVGGLPVASGGTTRSGMLYRGDAIDSLSDDGIAAMKQLRLRTIVDLREPVERRGPNTLADAHCEQLPILRDRFDYVAYDGIADLYSAIIDIAGNEIATAIARLSEPRAFPALVHCTAGKDRTGLVVGFLLAALGVPDEAVAANYGLSEANLTDEAREKVFKRATEAGLPAQKLAVMVGSPPQLMLDSLQHVRSTHGTVVGYLTAHGLRDTAITDLRRNLVDLTA